MHIAAMMIAGRAHDAAVMVARVLDCDSLPFCTRIASLLATNLVGAHCSARFCLFGSSVCAATHDSAMFESSSCPCLYCGIAKTGPCDWVFD